MQIISISSGHYKGKILTAVKLFAQSGEPICKLSYSAQDYIDAQSCAATLCTSLRRHGGPYYKSLKCRRRGSNVYLTNSDMSSEDFRRLLEEIL